jgi:protein-disulfide isomerase
MRRFIPVLCTLAIVAGCSRPSEPEPVAAPPDSGTAAAAPRPAPESTVPVPPALVSSLVRSDSPVLGPKDAPVTLVEFLDPACEACRAFAPLVKQIQFLHPENVRVVVRFANFHHGSEVAIRILLAAQRQKKFEPVLAALFDQQETWASHAAPDPQAAWKIAAGAGLDVARARKDADSAEITARLQQEEADLVALQVHRTPTFYVNGKIITDYGVQRLLKTVNAEVEQAAPASH